jgi:hypothetical protein
VTGAFWLIALLVVAAAVGVGVLRWQLHKRKVAEFTAFAATIGWRYAERDDSLAARFLGTPFGRGFGRTARHVLAGDHRGREAMAFEYSYKEREGSGKNQRIVTYTNTVAAVTTPAARPTLEVGREGIGRRLLGLVGIRDLQLESEEFNKAFHIRTEDDKFAYDILHPRTMEWMLAEERCRELPFRFERADLVTWRPGGIDLAEVGRLLDYLCDVLDRVPGFVWKP